MPIVDAHCHIYPEKIAARAVQSVGDFYSLEMDGDGTADRLLEYMKQGGITHAIVHSVAVKPHNVTSINNFIIEQCRQHPEFIGFMTMHPDFDDPEAEIERCLGTQFDPALGRRFIELVRTGVIKRADN